MFICLVITEAPGSCGRVLGVLFRVLVYCSCVAGSSSCCYMKPSPAAQVRDFPAHGIS